MTPRSIDLVVGRWGARYRGKSMPCSIGRSGIGVKTREGDGLSPLGTFRIVGSGFRSDRTARPNACFVTRAIGLNDVWSDDPADPDYNQGLASPDHPFSHEALFRHDRLYDLFAVLDFNWPQPVPGSGSAIFLHNWRKPRHPTEGCVAFAPDTLRHIFETWVPEARVVIG